MRLPFLAHFSKLAVLSNTAVLLLYILCCLAALELKRRDVRGAGYLSDFRREHCPGCRDCSHHLILAQHSRRMKSPEAVGRRLILFLIREAMLSARLASEAVTVPGKASRTARPRACVEAVRHHILCAARSRPSSSVYLLVSHGRRLYARPRYYRHAPQSPRLFGFKSFADKTVFNFHEGVTAIVGPNGCGKSNVLDAVRWVLGEQSAKALRGGEMADVIFNGTDSRKPVGYAEVSLTFTDCSSELGVDWHDVRVTRRVYRDGLSEYLLNKTVATAESRAFSRTPARAQPYRDGAGRIDQILTRDGRSARSFEEAAGIPNTRQNARRFANEATSESVRLANHQGGHARSARFNARLARPALSGVAG